MNHNDAVARALVALSRNGCMVARREVGLFFDVRGNKRSIGVEGEADIQGRCRLGYAVACEVKVGKDVLRKPQRLWRRAFQRSPRAVYILARYSDAEDGDLTINEAIAEHYARHEAS